MAFASILTTVAELIPPLIIKRIVDDVLVPPEGAAQGGADRVWLLGMLVLVLVGVRLDDFLAGRAGDNRHPEPAL